MRINPLFYLCALLGLILTSCIPPSEATYDGVALDINDPVSRKLFEYQDQHLTDSLASYFAHENPSYRYLAARAFGSYSDPTAHKGLVKLLSDPFDLVRSAAAYAIGQQNSPDLANELIKNFAPDTSRTFSLANSEILQAVGKTGDVETLKLLATTTTYQPTDTALLAGQAWSIFYFGRRGITDTTGILRALELSSANYPQKVRYPALAYLARYTKNLSAGQVNNLIRELSTTENADLRMLQVTAISKNTEEGTLNILLAQLNREQDWRVKVNLLRALGKYNYLAIKQAAIESLNDKNPQVSLTAAELLLAKGQPEDAATYWKMARDSFPWQTSYKLYQAANRHLPVYFSDYRGSINYQVQQRFAAAQNLYDQAAAITALSDFPWNYRIIQELGFASSSEVVRTTSVQALAYISEREDFVAFFRNSTNRVRADLGLYFKQAIETGDAGMIYEAAQPLSKPGNPYIGTYPDLSWADDALKQLPLPEMIESYRALEGAIAVLRGGTPTTEYPAPEYNHPIDWKIIEKAGPSPTVRIRTDKGNIDILLWPEMAATTISSFLKLAGEGFYDDKPFHRVGPEFVAQVGDPRADG